MARTFNGTSDYIDLSIGGMSSVAAPFTCMAIVNRSAIGSRCFAAINSGTTRRSEFKFNGSSLLRWTLPGVNDADVTGLTVTDTSGWAIVGISKATGSAAPRGHRYLYTGGTWTHANSGTSIGNPTAGTGIRLGAIATPADYWAGDIAVVGFWNRVLSDAETETLTTALSAWLSLSPATLLPLDQASTATAVTDATSGGAAQTAISGTSVSSSDPPGFSYALSTSWSVSGTVAATSSAALDVTAQHQVSATAPATSTAALDVTTQHTVSGTVAASSNAALAVTSQHQVTGAIPANTSTSLAVTAQHAVAGTAPAASDTALDITAQHAVSGTVTAVSAAALTLDQAGVAGTIAAVSGTSLDVTTNHQVSGTVEAASSTALDVTSNHAVTGAVAAVSGVQLVLSGNERDISFTGHPRQRVLTGRVGVRQITGRVGG